MRRPWSSLAYNAVGKETCIYKESSWKPNSNTQESDRPQHGCPAACDIAQQCSTANCIARLFHYSVENFSTLSKNSIISIFLLFLQLRKSSDVCTNLWIADNGRFSDFVIKQAASNFLSQKTVRCETPDADFGEGYGASGGGGGWWRWKNCMYWGWGLVICCVHEI